MATNLIQTDTISHIYCKGIAGVGYAFRMQVQFREVKNDEITKQLQSGKSLPEVGLNFDINACLDVDINVNIEFGEWMSSNETKKCDCWKNRNH